MPFVLVHNLGGMHVDQVADFVTTKVTVDSFESILGVNSLDSLSFNQPLVCLGIVGLLVGQRGRVFVSGSTHEYRHRGLDLRGSDPL